MTEQSTRKEMREARRIIKAMAGCHRVTILEAIEHLRLNPGEAVEACELIKQLARDGEEQ